MNIKKIGLTALAGSLVAVSAANAGSMSASGSASFEVQHVNGGAVNTGKAYSMGNSVTFAGSGELDNGLTVTTSFELDQGAEAGTAGAAGKGPFDSHGLTVGSDAFGTLTFQGHGGAAAQSAVDDMATGDIWDNGMGHAAAPTSSSSNNMLAYSLPSLMDGVSVDISYVPHTGTQYEDSVDIAVAYTGVEGLTIGYASGENKTTKGSEADVSTYYITYAYGPILSLIHI